MARKRRSLNYWETGKRDSGSGERFARIGGSLLRHPAFLALPYSARFLYICMIEASKGEREFSFPQSVYAEYGYDCKGFARGKAALIDGGFIELVESGKTTRTPNKYRFCEAYKTR